MLRLISMTAAVLVAGTALSDENCLKDAVGQQCDVFLDDYRANETPVGTTDFSPTKPYLVENFDDSLPQVSGDSPRGDDVLYSDGDSTMIVPEESGPRIKIADW